MAKIFRRWFGIVVSQGNIIIRGWDLQSRDEYILCGEIIRDVQNPIRELLGNFHSRIYLCMIMAIIGYGTTIGKVKEKKRKVKRKSKGKDFFKPS